MTDQEAKEIAGWQERAGLAAFTPTGVVAAARAAAAQRTRNKQDAAGERPKQKRSQPDRVARRFWIQNKCPRCLAGKGKNCVNDTRSGTGEVRKVPHAERVKPVLEERKGSAGKRRLRATDITCPDCRRPPGPVRVTQRRHAPFPRRAGASTQQARSRSRGGSRLGETANGGRRPDLEHAVWLSSRGSRVCPSVVRGSPSMRNPC